jgi:tape measure domain-containing protein
MAGEGNPDVEFDVSGNFADLEKGLTAAITRAMAAASKEMVAGVREAFRKLGASAENDIKFAKKMDDETKRAQKSLDRLNASFDAIAASSAGIAGSFGDALDPRVIRAFDDQLKRVVTLQEELAAGAETMDPASYKRLTDQTKLLATGLISARNAAESTKRAVDETNRNVSRDGRQVSRELIANKRAETSRFVVEQQAQSSAARDAARLQVEATRDASRRRVALIQAAARTIATIERGLSTVFRGTAQVIGGAFKGLGATVGGVAAGLRKTITNNNTQIANDYSNTFKRSTRTVQNETRQQASVINNFAQEAKASISSISGVGGGAKFGLGAAIGGILGVGFAKALSGGFDRATILENSERALTKLLGTAEKAKTLLDQVTEVVTGTPFRLDQFAAGASQLLAFNIEAEKIPEILRTISDAAALSLDPDLTVDRLIRTFGQISAAGKLTTEDINQLTETGVPAWALLGNQIGKTVEEMRKLVTDGAVPAEQAIDLLLNGIQNGTDGVNGATVAFAGLSKELGGTLKGSLANFNTSISRLGANIITAFRAPFTAALGAATAAVDLLGSALKILAVEIEQSPTFQLIQRGLAALTETLKEAKTTLAPVFSFLSGGLVLLGQAAAGLLVLKSIPGVLRALGSAIKFILAPQRLLIAGLVLAASYFKKLYDDSITLREGIAEVAYVLGRIATVIKDLVVDSFEAVASAFTGAGEATSEAGSQIKGVLRPALERLASFLENTVLPAVRNFAKTVREDVLPFIGTALSNAIGFAKDAFAALVEFIRSEVIPVVGPILSKAVDVAREAFEKFYDFIADKLVPFIQSNLLPVLAGVGTALGVLALSGGNIPLAGLAGLTAGIVAVLSDEEIRNALVASVQEGVKRAQAALKELFDGVTISGIIKGALKVANQIGKVLGDIASDRRLLTALAGIAAGAVALGAAFVAGFVEGIINNIPELIAGLSNALEVAFEAAVKGFVNAPLLTKALVAAFAGVGVLAAIAAAGRKASQTFQKAATFGPSLGTAPSGGAAGFVSALFGGPGAIERQVTAQVAKTEKQLKREFQRLQRVAVQATGDVVKSADGRFLKTTNAKELTAGIQEIENRIGKTNLAAAQLRAGIGQVGDAFRKGTPFLTNFSDGLRSIGQGIKGAAPAIGQAAGAIAGGAFAAAFVSRAIFDIDASGVDKLQAGVGLAASAITVGAIAGAPAGIAVAGFGLLTSKLNANEVAANNAKAAITQYADAIASAGSTAEAVDLLGGIFDVRTKDASTELLGTLRRIGFSYEDFANSVRNGNVTDEFEGLGEVLNTSIDGLERALEAGEGPTFLQQAFDASGGSIDVVIELLRLLGPEIDRIEGGFERAAAAGEGFGRIREGVGMVVDRLNAAKAITDLAATAAQTYKDKLTELNDLRIQGLRDKVNDARDALNEAGEAADTAKEKLRQFLSGETTETSAEQKIRDAVIAADSLGDSVAQIDLNKPLNAVDTSNFETAVADAQALVGGVLTDAQPATAADLAKLVDPLKQAINESDASPEVKGWLQAGVENAIAAYQSDPGQSLLAGVVDQNAENAAAQTVFDTALRNLKVGEALPADLFVLNTEAAETAAATAAQDVIDGWVAKFDGNTEMQEALKAQGEAAIDDFLKSVGTNSPSTITEQAGADVAQGFVNGIEAGATQMTAASRSAGIQSMIGLVIGLRSGSSAVYSTIRAIGARMITELRKELEVESPSKVMERIGVNTIEGFIVGVDKSLPLIDRIAFSAATRISNDFKEIGARAGQAIGIGFAEEGIGFAGSVAGALDDAAGAALSKVDQFKVIGQSIASALFGKQGSGPLGVTGGGSLAVGLEQAFLKIVGNSNELIDKFQARVKELDKNGGLAFTFDRQFALGRDNRQDFLESGLAIRNYGQTLLDAGRSADSAAGEMRHYRDQIINVARGMGATDDEINEMVNSLGLADGQLAKFTGSVNEVTRAAQAAAAAAAATAAEQRRVEQRQSVEDNKFAVGAISDDKYLGILRGRLADEKKYSDEWTAIWLEIQRILEKQADEKERKAEEKARKAEEKKRKITEELERRAREAEEKKREAEERARLEYTFQQPVFRDLVVQSPSGDPEAVALATANRVAFSIRR